MNTRIVVTGTGVFSSLAAGREEFEKALYEGGCGIVAKTLFPEIAPNGLAGEIRDFTPQQWAYGTNKRDNVRVSLQSSARSQLLIACVMF